MWPGYRQRVERSLGSGVILDTDGHIVTNNHVIDAASIIKVQLADGRVAEAKVMGRDADTDLAVLQIELPDLPAMALGRSDTLRVGDVVLAIGNPVGLSQTVTQGIVSATGRGNLRVARFENFIQTDAAINLGNSGGALVNTAGELVGINTAIFARNAGIEGIGFAIPVNLVRGVMEEIFKNGRVIRGWLGVVPQNVTPEQARALGAPDGGVFIANLYKGSPALRAGLLPGDLITQLDDEPMRRARIVEMGPDGRPLYRVEAERLQQDPSDNSVQMNDLKLVYHSVEARDWTLTAAHGFVPPGSRTLDLAGDVTIVGQPQPNSPSAVVRTSRLSVDTQTNIATSRERVDIEWGPRRITTMGVTADLKAERLKLESSVHDHRVDGAQTGVRDWCVQYELVQPLELLDIGIDLIHEQRIQHVSENLSRCRSRADPHLPERATQPALPHSDHEQPVRAQVDRRAQGIRLSHGAVAVVLIGQAHRGEQKWNGQARHQVIEAETAALPASGDPFPVVQIRSAFVERHAAPAAEARGTDADGVQPLLGDRAMHGAKGHRAAEKLAQWRVVEQRFRRRQKQAAGRECQQPMQPRTQHAERIRSEYLVDVKIRPYLFKGTDGSLEAPRTAGECDCGNRARRRAEDDRERTGALLGQPLRKRLQHADLVGRARTSTRQYQCSAFRRFAHGPIVIPRT